MTIWEYYHVSFRGSCISLGLLWCIFGSTLVTFWRNSGVTLEILRYVFKDGEISLLTYSIVILGALASSH